MITSLTYSTDDLLADFATLAAEQQEAHREAIAYHAAAQVARPGSLKRALDAAAAVASRDALALTMLMIERRALYRRAG